MTNEAIEDKEKNMRAYDKLKQYAYDEWKESMQLRKNYPTFVFYFRERYERVYAL